MLRAPKSVDNLPHPRKPTRWTASLTVQILLLVLLSVITAQLVNIAVILTAAPSFPPITPPSQVAAVLLGKAPNSIASKFTRDHAAHAPQYDSHEDFEESAYRNELAKALALDPRKVRVSLSRPLPPFPDRGPGRFGAPPPLRPGFGPPGLSLAAAAEFDPGTWTTVSSRPVVRLDPWQQRVLLWFLATILIVAPLGYAFARHLTAPIRRFAEAAEMLGRDPGAPSLVLRGPAEIGVAAAAFNRMQERLRRYVDGRTSMIAAIAHDLRTPLTRLAFRLEAFPADVRNKAYADIVEMEEMISATLAFVRHTSQPPRRERLSLHAIVQNTADELIDMGADIVVEPGERIIMNGDPSALRRLIRNLLSNAIKYGTRARARVTTEGDNAVIEVEDDGEGLEEDEIPKVFEPFYRTEKSRNRLTGGIGLGLSVVRSIAHQHGGEVNLFNSPVGGLCARVVLPL